MWRKPSRKTIFKGITPKGDGWEFLGRVRGEARNPKQLCSWRVYLSRNINGWDYVKLACSESRKGKANFSLIYNGNEGRFARNSEYGVLCRSFPKLHESAFAVVKDAYVADEEETSLDGDSGDGGMR